MSQDTNRVCPMAWVEIPRGGARISTRDSLSAVLEMIMEPSRIEKMLADISFFVIGTAWSFFFSPSRGYDFFTPYRIGGMVGIVLTALVVSLIWSLVRKSFRYMALVFMIACLAVAFIVSD